MTAGRIRVIVRLAVAGVVAVGCGMGVRAARQEPACLLIAVGDVMLDRGVAAVIAAEGPAYPFSGVGERLCAADLAIGNLECPLSATGDRLPKPIAFRGDPALAPALAAAGFDIMNLANNHAVDCGRGALMGTIAHLRRANIRACGAGRDRAEAEAPVVLSAGGLRVAFLGFTEFMEGTRPYDHVPTIGLARAEAIAAAVRRARSGADCVVVSLHAGEEYDAFPSPLQRSFALAAAGAGADLVLGHHPHVLQGLEWVPRAGRRPALVIHSLGNFIFDQQRPGTAESIMLQCRLDRGGVTAADALPVVIQRCRPRAASADEGREILAELGRRSRPFGVRLTDGAVAVPL